MDQDPNAPPQAKRVGKAANAGGELLSDVYSLACMQNLIKYMQ